MSLSQALNQFAQNLGRYRGGSRGTFARVADTTRQADAATIKELLFEGSNRSFDQGTENAWKMHSNGVECAESALNVHGESTAVNRWPGLTNSNAKCWTCLCRMVQ